ncbi:cyclic-phosphate processing receiver domain-containing protein [Sorangium sp. So ce341]|uniref:cyclic-phosphate processing receiver domain-containing protein n=1 Tax=Sorangium sp. So ce341 TaxID=3133302 RepID=UPI003F5FDF59
MPEPLRVLLVEDTEDRQEVLTSLYRAHAWVLVPTGARAIALLSAYDFDIVSLDYNLRGERTGADVAESLARSRNRGARVVVHSQNPAGAERIRERLPGAVLYPLSRMIRTNAVARRLRAAIDEQGAAFEWDL